MEASETTPTVEETPEVDTNALLQQIIEQQQAHRAEVAELREELAASRKPQSGVPIRQQTEEELIAARMEAINDHSHYCPGCGKLASYPQQCTGTAEAPHQPIEVISTDELKEGDASKHTAAPDTTNLG